MHTQNQENDSNQTIHLNLLDKLIAAIDELKE